MHSPAATAARDLDDAERELVESARSLDSSAWAQIFDDNYRAIYNLARLRLGDQEAAEDVASQVFTEALAGIRRYHYRGVPLRAWLFRIARNLVADALRQRSRSTLATATLAADPVSADSAPAVQLRRDLEQGMRHLTPDQQSVLVLRFFLDLDVEEVAQALGKRPGAIRSLQFRALQQMRTELSR